MQCNLFHMKKWYAAKHHMRNIRSGILTNEINLSKQYLRLVFTVEWFRNVHPPGIDDLARAKVLCSQLNVFGRTFEATIFLVFLVGFVCRSLFVSSTFS